MGQTLHIEPIRPGEERRYAAKRGPSIRVERDTPSHPGMNPESMGELLIRPVIRHEKVRYIFFGPIDSEYTFFERLYEFFREALQKIQNMTLKRKERP